MSNEVNGVFVDLYDTYTEAPTTAASRDRTFIFGTATQGPRHTPTTPGDTTVEETFGEVKSDSSFDTSLVRGYYEFANMVAGNPDVALIRVGNVKAAKATLYENKSSESGKYMYTDNPDTATGEPVVSMVIEALEEGEKYNEGVVKVVSFDTSGEPSLNGFPTAMTIEIPGDDEDTTLSATYNLAKTPGAPGVYSSVSELVSAINATTAFSGKLKASYTPIKVTGVQVPIIALSGVTQYSYSLGNYTLSGGTSGSWGNNLVAISKAYLSSGVRYTIDAGETEQELDVSPNKSLTAGTKSIDRFLRVSEDELILTVTPITVGSGNTDVSLFCASVTGWDNVYEIDGYSATYSAGSAAYNIDTEDLFTPVVKVLRNGTSEKVTLDSSKYTINNTTGKITIKDARKLGDKYYATYRFMVSYKEAKYRSDLVTGSDRSYFIYGDTIIFGASQPMPVILKYDSNVYYSADDLEITDPYTSTVSFINAANRPALGKTVSFDLQFEPELPAVTGAVIGTGITQNGGFTGGDDGRMLSKRDYVKAVKAAMEAVAIFPRKQNVIMGLYLDEITTGPNEETGMIEEKALDWFSDIFPLIEDVSESVSECSIQIPVKPVTKTTVDAQNEWIDKVTNSSTSDPVRAANIIDSLNFYKADVIFGLPRVSISGVLGGTSYYANPAVVYAAMKSQLKAGESMTNKALNGGIADLGLKVQSSAIIGKLNSKRYTSFIVNHTGTFVVADAPTLGRKNESQFDRQFVRDSIYLAVEVARIAAEKYIGSPRRTEYLTAMRKDVMKALATLSPDVISDFYVEITDVPTGYITGETKMKMVLTTAKEIRTVKFETYVKLSS